MAHDNNVGIKVVLINLPKSIARFEAMESRLNGLNLTWQKFNAIDGYANFDTLKSTVDIASFRKNVGREVLPGEIGCYHSHLTVWTNFLNENQDLLLVLEDDVVFHDDFLNALSAAVECKEDWDFLKLNKIRAKQPIKQKVCGKFQINAYLGPATGLGAYLIKKTTIMKLLPNMLPITRPIDHELDRIHIHDFRHFGLEPFPSHVDDGNDSTITGKKYADVRKFVWYLRIPNYLLRISNLLHKFTYLILNNRLIKLNIFKN